MFFLGIMYFAFDEMALSGLIGYIFTFLYFLLIFKYMKYNKTGTIFTICIYVIYYIFVLSVASQNGLRIYTINISNCLWFIPLVLSIIVYVIIYLIKKNWIIGTRENIAIMVPRFSSVPFIVKMMSLKNFGMDNKIYYDELSTMSLLYSNSIYMKWEKEKYHSGLVIDDEQNITDSGDIMNIKWKKYKNLRVKDMMNFFGFQNVKVYYMGSRDDQGYDKIDDE